jgi:glycosyltransferase involved in cell wall biosynthesis
VRTAVVVAETPLPPTSGFRQRTLHLARQLARAADVDVLALGPVPGAGDEPFALRSIPHARSRWAALAGSARRPYLAAKHASNAQADAVRRGHYDTVQVESPFLVPAVVGRRPVILDAHNLEHELANSLVAGERRAVPRARWRWEAAKTERFEAWAARAVDAVCATNAAEAAAFDTMGSRRTIVVPNGVDTTEITYAKPAPDPTIVYVGHFGYRPNAAAARELAGDVFPRVAARVPGTRLTLVGRDAGPDLVALQSRAITVTGAVVSVLPHLRAARVVVLPIRAGSGTRLKILEAMAAGVPVVSTRLGAHGLDLQDGRDLLLADTAAELAEHTVRVLTDDGLAARLSVAARSAVERSYEWSVVARPLVALHAELAASPR